MSRNNIGAPQLFHRILWVILVTLCCVCAGCSSETDEDRIGEAVGAAPFHLDSEQVTLTTAQVNCGVDNDLFEPPISGSGRSIAKLKQAARDMGFSDDVTLDDPNYARPYAQVRGDFMLGIGQATEIKDGPEPKTKAVQAKLWIKLSHKCFTPGLTIMGISKGEFKQNLAPTVIFSVNDDMWHLERIVH
jgi:hypothetical protein